MAMSSDDEHADYEGMDIEEPQQQQRKRIQSLPTDGHIGNTRACQSCRASKVRCDQPNPSVPCLRCRKGSKPCNPAGQSWNNQSHLNSCITKMESKLDRVISVAASQRCESTGDRTRSTDFFPQHPTVKPSLQSGELSSQDINWDMNSIPLGLEETVTPYLDHITMETIINRYVTHFAPTFPVVIFPPGTAGLDVRKSNPVLFYAILDVASPGFCELDVQRRLRKLIVQTYVHYMLRTDLYTLGLLQALVVSATWYRSIEPLQPGEQMDIYQLSHTASNMALIMGLGKSLNAKSWGNTMSPRNRKENGLLSLDAPRVWLGCYYLCSNTSMSLHSPNIMRWTRTMDECLEALETSPAVFSDKVLCQLIRLQHITEEFTLQVYLEDSSAPILTRAIQRNVTHRAFKRQLTDWRKNAPTDVWNDVLEFLYHFSWLYINEVAMCMPYANASPDTNPASEDQQHLHGFTAHGPAFTEFLKTVDNIFLVFTSLDMSAIRSLPAMHLLRMIYTVIILVKLHLAAAQMANEEAQQQLDRASVSVRLDNIIQMFVGWGTLWPATKLTTAFSQIRKWFEKCKDGHGHTMQQHEGPMFTQWRVNPSAVNINEVDYSDFFLPNNSSDDGSGFLASWNGSNPMGGNNTPFTFDSALDFDFPTDFTLSNNNDPFANYPLPSSGSPTLMNSDATTDDVLDKL